MCSMKIALIYTMQIIDQGYVSKDYFLLQGAHQEFLKDLWFCVKRAKFSAFF